MASALREISRCRVLDRAAVQAAWDRMAKGLAILLSQPGRWDAPDNQLRGNVEWLLCARAAQAKTFGRIEFDADGKRFIAAMVERDGRWLVSSIQPRPAS